MGSVTAKRGQMTKASYRRIILPNTCDAGNLGQTRNRMGVMAYRMFVRSQGAVEVVHLLGDSA